MTIAAESPYVGADATDDAYVARWPSPLAVAACASIAAGGIHAAVVGAHAEHRFLATIFVWAAAFQVVWGIATLLRPTRAGTAVGMVGNAAAAAFWLTTRLTSISSIKGLEVRESVHYADAVGAGLAVVAAGIALGALLTPAAHEEHHLSNLSIPAFLIACLALPAMVTGGTDLHTHGASDATTTTATHDHGGASSTGLTTDTTHSHDVATTTGTTVAPTTSIDNSGSVVTEPPATTTTFVPAVVPPVPYDPTKPLDFGGVDGVTPEQQAAAENLVAITLARLPKFADYRVAESLGWKSIGDCITGYEHFINKDLFDDGRMLDPDFPESLVYQTDCSENKQLVSAMFMAEPGLTLANVPDIGGKLMQWHIHDNLCFTVDGQVRGLTLPDGSCAPPLVKGPEIPMIHVWIVPNACGPFAALEGVGAGQILPGEQRWCDHVHGAGG